MKQKASERDQTGEIREETHDVERLKIKRKSGESELICDVHTQCTGAAVMMWCHGMLSSWQIENWHKAKWIEFHLSP
jgi:hypothetical protein